MLTAVLMGGRQGLESEEKAMQLLLETEIQVRSQRGKGHEKLESQGSRSLLLGSSQKETALLIP